MDAQPAIAGGHGHAGAGREAHAHTSYMTIFWWLFALTIIEVGLGYGVKYLEAWKPLLIASLIVVAGVKAGLVAAYFMHLRFERRTLTLIAIFPVLLLVILTFALYPDASSFHPQGNAPGQPAGAGAGTAPVKSG